MRKTLLYLSLIELASLLIGCVSAAPAPTLSAEKAYAQTIDQINLLYSTANPITPRPSIALTVTPTPTQTPTDLTSSPITATLTRTPAGAPCYRARVLSESPAPYSNLVSLGEYFVKTWTLLNTGSCRWSADVQLVYVQVAHNKTSDILDQMSGPDQQRIGVDVAVGQTVEVSVALIAPLTPGQYAGYWMLRNTYGGRFGEGLRGESAFSVTLQLRLAAPTNTPALATVKPTNTPIPTGAANSNTPTELPTILPTSESPMSTDTTAPTDT